MATGVSAPIQIKCEDCEATISKTGSRKRLCSDCKRKRKLAQDLRYRETRREVARIKAREWLAANRDRANVAKREYSRVNRERLLASLKEKYRANPEIFKERARKWYAKNRELVLSKARSDAGRKRSRDRMARKLRTDPQFRLSSNISRAIYTSIKDKKRRSWESLVGYNLADLIRHIERQFVRGMTWKNHGRGPECWHIDHILPKALFNFESAEDADFRACWALTNLRPMWSRENISKHAKRTLLL